MATNDNEAGKNLGGRPPIYKEDFCQQLIDHMAQGLSFESFAGTIDVDRSTLYLWCKQHPKFLDAKKKGRDRGLAALERMALDGMRGKIKNWNPVTWIFYMKNMHRDLFSDRQQIEVTAKPTVIERLDGAEIVLGIEEKKD